MTFIYDLEDDRVIGNASIGRGTYWGLNTRFVTFLESERVVIGRYCSIADNVTIASGGEHWTSTVSTWPFDNFITGLPNPTRTYRPIPDTVIGSDVWIGFGAHIVGGSRVGHGAVIGARAVVMGDVPPYAIVAGNRAEVIRHRFSADIIEALLAIAWWEWPPARIAENLDMFYGDIDSFIAKHVPTTPGSPNSA
ncbi:MAG: hypothetical protein QOC72_2868 [Methylobacteriaceae bacterium]|jgi:acetyltransferase-like isoleucine patch superfamily enzyme|nr:hypothetical protein [Methylobacteriaceae bacterium]